MRGGDVGVQICKNIAAALTPDHMTTPRGEDSESDGSVRGVQHPLQPQAWPGPAASQTSWSCTWLQPSSFRRWTTSTRRCCRARNARARSTGLWTARSRGPRTPPTTRRVDPLGGTHSQWHQSGAPSNRRPRYKPQRHSPRKKKTQWRCVKMQPSAVGNRGGGSPSGPNSTPEAFPDPNTSLNRIFNHQ